MLKCEDKAFKKLEVQFDMLSLQPMLTHRLQPFGLFLNSDTEKMLRVLGNALSMEGALENQLLNDAVKGLTSKLNSFSFKLQYNTHLRSCR